MSDRRGKLKFIVIFALVFMLGVSLGKGLDNVLASSDSIYSELELFTNALNLIRDNYVEDVDTKELIYGAIEGMVSSLDVHSAFYRPEDYNEFMEDTKGSFGGLGIEISTVDGILTIIAPIEDTPAWEAGLKAGDKILFIEGESTEGMTAVDAVKVLRGPKGTQVTITVLSEGETTTRDVTITRDIIEIHSVKYEVYEDNIVYIRITTFQERTTTDLRDALDVVTDETNGDITGIILDLRNDPGGLLSRSVDVSDMFLSEGTIVSIKGKEPSSNAVFSAHREGTIADIPMVVLVNGGSASASEIVAGALKDNGRAILIGTTTFGKGSVQTIIRMKDGSGLRITTALYYTPSGASIHDIGIDPDIEVTFPDPEEVAETGDEAADETVPEDEVVDETASEEEAADEEMVDVQLEKAKEVIAHWSSYEYLLK